MKNILYTAARKVFILLIFKGKVLRDCQTVRGFVPRMKQWVLSYIRWNCQNFTTICLKYLCSKSYLSVSEYWIHRSYYLFVSNNSWKLTSSWDRTTNPKFMNPDFFFTKCKKSNLFSWKKKSGLVDSGFVARFHELVKFNFRLKKPFI